MTPEVPRALAERERSVGSYSADRDGRLVSTHEGPPPSALTELVHDAFRGLVSSRHFSCVGAKSAIGHGQYRFGLYGSLGTEASAADLAPHLRAFADAYATWDGRFACYLATFTGPTAIDAAVFEQLLWRQLQQLHHADTATWDPRASRDPEDASFAFSFAGRAFFVIGLHAASERVTRRFAWPTLVFNPHEQFDRLREDGKFEAFRDRVRDRERTLQGSVLGSLADFGEASEARQYAGRSVGPGWRCPFQGKSGRTPG